MQRQYSCLKEDQRAVICCYHLNYVMEMSFKNYRKVESKNMAVMGLGCFLVAFFF